MPNLHSVVHHTKVRRRLSIQHPGPVHWHEGSAAHRQVFGNGMRFSASRVLCPWRSPVKVITDSHDLQTVVLRMTTNGQRHRPVMGRDEPVRVAERRYFCIFDIVSPDRWPAGAVVDRDFIRHDDERVTCALSIHLGRRGTQVGALEDAGPGLGERVVRFPGTAVRVVKLGVDSDGGGLVR